MGPDPCLLCIEKQNLQDRTRFQNRICKPGIKPHGAYLEKGRWRREVRGQGLGGRAGGYVGLPFFLFFYFILFIPLEFFYLNYPGGYIGSSATRDALGARVFF